MFTSVCFTGWKSRSIRLEPMRFMINDRVRTYFTWFYDYHGMSRVVMGPPWPSLRRDWKKSLVNGSDTVYETVTRLTKYMYKSKLRVILGHSIHDTRGEMSVSLILNAPIDWRGLRELFRLRLYVQVKIATSLSLGLTMRNDISLNGMVGMV